MVRPVWLSRCTRLVKCDQADRIVRFFDRCHPNAPFLDAQYDRNMELVRSTSVALFLNIVVVGARFWGHPDK